MRLETFGVLLRGLLGRFLHLGFARAVVLAELARVLVVSLLGVLGVFLGSLLGGSDGVARGVAEHALVAAAPALVLVVELLPAEHHVGEVLEGDGEIKLVADVVAGFARGPWDALALDDEVVVDHAPLLAGHALDLLPGHGKVEAGVAGDCHRGLLELLLLGGGVAAVGSLGGHKLLRDVAPAP